MTEPLAQVNRQNLRNCRPWQRSAIRMGSRRVGIREPDLERFIEARGTIAGLTRSMVNRRTPRLPGFRPFSSAIYAAQQAGGRLFESGTARGHAAARRPKWPVGSQVFETGP